MKRTTRTNAPLVEPRQSTGPEQPQFAAFINQRYFDFGRRFAYPDSRGAALWQRWRRSLR